MVIPMFETPPIQPQGISKQLRGVAMPRSVQAICTSVTPSPSWSTSVWPTSALADSQWWGPVGDAIRDEEKVWENTWDCVVYDCLWHLRTRSLCTIKSVIWSSKNPLVSSGQRLHNYGLNHRAINGKTHELSVAMFHSYVTLPEGYNVVPPSYKLIYNPVTIVISTINHSDCSYKPT